MTEVDFDRILFQALMENAIENNQKLLDDADKNKPHIFSENYNKRMFNDLKKAGINSRSIIKVRHNTNYYKFIISSVASFVILIGTTAVIPQTRAIIWEPIIEWIESRINIYFGSTSKEKIDNYIYPQYIPDDYEKIYENITESNADIFYSNGSEYINFSYYVSSVTVNIDDKISDYQSLKINGSQAYLFVNDGMKTLLWHDENYVFELNAQNSDIDLVQIAESIYFEEKNEVK